MKSYLANYNLQSDQWQEATVLLFEKEIQIGYYNAQDKYVTEKWLLAELGVQYEMATAVTSVKNNSRTSPVFYIKGKDVATEIEKLQLEQQKPWHKKEKGKNTLRYSFIFLGLALLLALLYFLFVPKLSELMVGTISTKTEQKLGDAVFDALSENVNEAATLVASDFFANMHVPSSYQIRITVVRGDVVNAYALPGGRIVVYDALLKQLESYTEFAALLAHEFSHVQYQHATKSIFRKLGSKIFISLLFGRMGSVANVLAEQADDIKSLTYSRGLEKEADLKGLAILTERKIDPKGFSDLFLRLKQETSRVAIPEFLNSHPEIDKRIEYIKQSSKDAVVEDDVTLKTIFEKLKKAI